MSKRRDKNKGFSLIELLIALAILSVLALMISRFMTSTVASYRKNKQSLELQSDSSRIMTQLSDAISQANYIRIASSDPSVDYQLVPDNYGNYVNPDKTKYRKVVVDPATYQLVDVTTKNSYYPLSSDLDSASKVCSFRILDSKYTGKMEPLKDASDNVVKDAEGNVVETFSGYPMNYIYIEYVDKDSTKSVITKSIIFKWDGKNLRMVRNDAVNLTDKDRFDNAKKAVDAKSGEDALMTDLITDFKIHANVDEEALLTYIKFEKGNYSYEMNESIKFRNSNVLTVSPQKLFKTFTSESATTAGATTELATEAPAVK